MSIKGRKYSNQDNDSYIVTCFWSQFNLEMFNRSTLVVFLNRTNEELCLETQTQQLHQGVWAMNQGPPLSILAGECGLWKSESRGAGRGTRGSVTYHIAGDTPEQQVLVSWKIPFFGKNSYKADVPAKGFELEVQGGWGMHGTVVFIFRMSRTRTCPHVCSSSS